MDSDKVPPTSYAFKNKGTSILLTILFGPIGLFYATVMGGMVMSLFFALVVFAARNGSYYYNLNSGLIFCFWFVFHIVCVVHGINGVKRYNTKLLEEGVVWDFSLYESVRYVLFPAFVFCLFYACYDNFIK